MADNYPIKDGTGTSQVMAAKLVGGILHPRHIGEGMFAGTPTDFNMTNAGALDVTLIASLPAGANTIGTVNLGSLSGAATAAKQPALGTPGAASADVLSIQGILGMIPLKVDGSGFTQPISGSLTNIAGTISLPTGAAIAAKQPALGTAGTASADVITVQGIASGTPQPVSAASLPLPTGAATAALQGAQGTGSTYNPPTGGSGEIGYLSGIFAAVSDTTPNVMNITQVAGVAIAQGHGTAAAAIRVELPTDGTGVVGLAAGAAKVGVVTTDQTTHGTTDLVAADITKVAGSAVATGHGTASGALRVELPTDGTGTVGLNSGAFDVATTIARPANITAYTANDVLGGALDLGVLGPSGAAVQINSIQLEADIAAIPAGQTSWLLYLYNVTPPSAVADNGAFDLPLGDRASFLGSIAISAMADLGSTLYVEINNIGKQVKLSGTHLFAYLVTVGGFTPNANSEAYKLTVHTVAL